MKVPSHPTHLKSQRSKLQANPKAAGLSHSEHVASTSRALRQRSRSVDDLQPLRNSQSPVSVTDKIEETPKKNKSPRKKLARKERALKVPSPSAIALASSELRNEDPRSITPPRRALPDTDLHDDSHSKYGYGDYDEDDEDNTHVDVDPDVRTARAAARASLANLFKLDDAPKVIRTTRPLWMKPSATPTRQRMPPPPESPQAGKAKLMVQQRKSLLRSSSHERILDVGDVVQRRRKKNFDKSVKASTKIQRLVRGWLVRTRIQHRSKNSKRKDPKNKKENKVRKKRTEKKEREICRSPGRSVNVSSLEPRLTPVQNAMRQSLRRKGASEKDLAYKLSASQQDLLTSPFDRKDPVTPLFLYTTSNHKNEDTDLEQNLCNMFKSNIANATARARRRSFRGETSDAFANLEGIL